MTRSHTPLTWRTAALPQDMENVPRRRTTSSRPSPKSDLICTICDKRFNRKFDLTRHRELHLPKSEQKRHLCNWPGCYYSALQKTNLTTHINAVHLQMKNYRCRVEECQKAFSDAASKIRHEKNVHGILPTRTRRNRSASVQEYQGNVDSGGEESDVLMESGSTPVSRAGSPRSRDQWSEGSKVLENVSPYTLVPSNFFINQSSPFAHNVAPNPPPSPTPSNYTSISTSITDLSQNAPEGSIHSLDTNPEIVVPKSLLTASSSRNRAYSVPNIFIVGNERSIGRSRSPRDAIVSEHHSIEVESFVSDQAAKVTTENAKDPFDAPAEPQIRLPGIDDLLRGPTASRNQTAARRPEAIRNQSSGSHRTLQPSTTITSLQVTRPRSHSAVVDMNRTINSPESLSTTGELRSRSGDTPLRRVNTRPINSSHFSPYGASADRERSHRPITGSRARAYSDVFTPNPTRPIGILERSTAHLHNDRYHAYRGNTTEDGNTDERRSVASRSPSVANPRSESRDPLFGALLRRPSISTSPSRQPSIRMGSPQCTSANERYYSCGTREPGELPDHGGLAREPEQRVPELFISTIMTSEPLSPQEGASCRVLRSDGRIVSATLVEKHVAVSDKQA